MITAQSDYCVNRAHIDSLKHVCAPNDTYRQDAIDYAFHMGIVELCGDPLIDAQMIALSWDEITFAYDRYLDDCANRAEYDTCAALGLSFC